MSDDLTRRGSIKSHARPVVDFTLSVIEISEANYWKLPAVARETIALCGRPLPAPAPGVLAWEVATYLVADLDAMTRRVTP